MGIEKIALCLEQRISGKKIIPGISSNLTTKGDLSLKEVSSSSNILLPRPSHSSCGGGGGGVGNSYHGCLILGSNGSGKTSICEAIMNGNTGTKGLLNRKLLACYFVNSQNPDCHSLSVFIRSIVLQILSHSSMINKQEQQQQQQLQNETKEVSSEENKNNEKSKLNLEYNNSIDDNTEQFLNDEIKSEIDMMNDKSLEQNKEIDEKICSSTKKIIIRQKSAPSPEKKIDNTSKISSYSTHPPKSAKSLSQSSTDTHDMHENYEKDSEFITTSENNDNKPKSSPGKNQKFQFQ